MSVRGKLLRLPPNRVWRTYPGGRTLDQLAGLTAPADTPLAEDWIASATRAVNRGREHLAEGVSQVRVGRDDTPRDFGQLLASDPEYFLGAAHVKKFGASPQLLVKFLDSGTRLHFQVHPTREFAQKFLGAPSGKTEAYHVLSCRAESPNSAISGDGALSAGFGDPALQFIPEPTGYIYVGFQRPPAHDALKKMIEAQDIAAIEACFDKIPVRPGDTFIIPGGTPHALGAGVFMVEIQEPSDLVVRFEFERAGYVLPEPARFMERGLDFALTVFNLTPLTLADVEARVRCRPRRVRDFGGGSWQDELIGPAQTDRFRVTKTHLAGPVVKDETSCAVAIVTAGGVTVEAGDEMHRLNLYDKVFLPAGLGRATFTPTPPGPGGGDGRAEILECHPPV